MLSPKQASYINLGLEDSRKCAYYYRGTAKCFVYINSANCKNANLPIYTLKFEDRKSARYFAEHYITHGKYEFDVLVDGDGILLEPIMVDGKLRIDCGENVEMAKKLVKRFRAQYIRKLDMCKRSEKSNKKDFKGIQF